MGGLVIVVVGVADHAQLEVGGVGEEQRDRRQRATREGGCASAADESAGDVGVWGGGKRRGTFRDLWCKRIVSLCGMACTECRHTL
jgi:hypothetical protein